jgi:multiple sugar transport system permease protein
MLTFFFVPFFIFGIYPITQSAYFSLTDYSGSPTAPVNFLGLENFLELLRIEIVELPRLVDEDSSERIYQCGRRKYPESATAEHIADGKDCGPAFPSVRAVASDGFREWREITANDERRIVIAATDPRFWTAVYNTTRYVLFTVSLNLVLGLCLALILQRQSLFNMLMRTIFFLPTVTAGIAITIVWGWIFQGKSFGLINSIRMERFAAPEPIPFLVDPAYMIPILIFLAIWGGVGYNMILFLAGLGAIPAELYEAATVDGATIRQKFRKITLPLLRPTTLFLVVTGIIGSFQLFDAAYVLFATNAEGAGGPQDGALTVVGYLYDRGFHLFQLGYASSIAWVLFTIIFVFTLLNLRVGRINEAY